MQELKHCFQMDSALTSGGVEVLTAFNGKIRLLLPAPSERVRTGLQADIESAPYKSVPGDNWIFRGNVQNFKNCREDLVSAHHDFH